MSSTKEVIQIGIDTVPAVAAVAGFIATRALVFRVQGQEEEFRDPQNEVVESITRELDEVQTDAHEYSIGDTTEHAFLKIAEEQVSHTKTTNQAEKEAESEPKRKYSRESMISRVVLRSLPFLAASTAYFAADAVSNESYPVGNKPSLSIVVDRSGGSKYPAKKGEAAPKVRADALLKEFNAHSSEISSAVYVAKSSATDEVSLAESISNPELQMPGGDAPMKEAFNSALSRAVMAKASDEPDRKSSSVIVITNGNNFISKKGKAQAEKKHIPVTTINVGESDEADTFSSFAKKTGGQYIEKDVKPKAAFEKTMAELEPARMEEGIDMNILPPLTLFAVGFGLALRELKHMPLTFRGLKDILNKKRS